jgi:hypothetical protein
MPKVTNCTASLFGVKFQVLGLECPPCLPTSLKENQIALNIISGTTLKEDDLVYSQVAGKPMLLDTVSHDWVKLDRRTVLEGIRLHDARQSHASLMLK